MEYVTVLQVITMNLKHRHEKNVTQLVKSAIKPPALVRNDIRMLRYLKIPVFAWMDSMRIQIQVLDFAPSREAPSNCLTIHASNNAILSNVSTILASVSQVLRTVPHVLQSSALHASSLPKLHLCVDIGGYLPTINMPNI